MPPEQLHPVWMASFAEATIENLGGEGHELFEVIRLRAVSEPKPRFEIITFIGTQNRNLGKVCGFKRRADHRVDEGLLPKLYFQSSDMRRRAEVSKADFDWDGQNITIIKAPSEMNSLVNNQTIVQTIVQLKVENGLNIEQVYQATVVPQELYNKVVQVIQEPPSAFDEEF